jgi:hypothetical protein
MKEFFKHPTVRLFDRDSLRFEARPSIGRTEGPVRSLLVAEVDRDGYVRQNSRFALGSPEVARLDQVG